MSDFLLHGKLACRGTKAKASVYEVYNAGRREDSSSNIMIVTMQVHDLLVHFSS